MKNVWIFALDQNCFLIAKIWKSQRKKKKAQKREKTKLLGTKKKFIFNMVLFEMF